MTPAAATYAFAAIVAVAAAAADVAVVHTGVAVAAVVSTFAFAAVLAMLSSALHPPTDPKRKPSLPERIPLLFLRAKRRLQSEAAACYAAN